MPWTDTTIHSIFNLYCVIWFLPPACPRRDLAWVGDSIADEYWVLCRNHQPSSVGQYARQPITFGAPGSLMHQHDRLYFFHIFKYGPADSRLPMVGSSMPSLAASSWPGGHWPAPDHRQRHPGPHPGQPLTITDHGTGLTCCSRFAQPGTRSMRTLGSRHPPNCTSAPAVWRSDHGSSCPGRTVSSHSKPAPST